MKVKTKTEKHILLALGTPVLYAELAGIARRGGMDQWNKGWHLPAKGNGSVAGYQIEEEDGEWAFDRNGLRIASAPRPVRFVKADGSELDAAEIEKYNKAIVTWAHEGSGVVCGLETKQYGTSYGPSGGTNLYGEGDWEPGYFVNHGQLKLYVVRSRLEGRDFVYVPTWAIRPMISS